MCLANARQLHVRLYSGRVSLVRCTSDWCREPQRSPTPRVHLPHHTAIPPLPIQVPHLVASHPVRSPPQPCGFALCFTNPWRCLCLGFAEQITYRYPTFRLLALRRTIYPVHVRNHTPLPKSHSQTYHAMLAPLPNSTVHLHPPRLLLHRQRLHRDCYPRPAAPAVQTCVVSWREGALGEGSDLGRGGESWRGGEREGAHRGEEGSRPEGLGEEREEGHGGGCGGGVHGVGLVGWSSLIEA